MALRAGSSYTLDLLSRFSCRFPNTLPERTNSIRFQNKSCSLYNEGRAAASVLTYICAEEPFVELGGVAGGWCTRLWRKYKTVFQQPKVLSFTPYFNLATIISISLKAKNLHSFPFIMTRISCRASAPVAMATESLSTCTSAHELKLLLLKLLKWVLPWQHWQQWMKHIVPVLKIYVIP